MNTTRKTTKGQLKEAVQSFLYRYDWLTGGTREETARQAPEGVKGLEAMAATVAQLAANPNKIAAADAHLMDYATRLVPLKLSLYRRHVPGTAEHAAKLEELAAQEAKDKAAFADLQTSELVAAGKVILFPGIA